MAKEYSKQDIKKAIEQLEKLRNHCLIMSIDAENAEWDKDVKALDLAIESLKPELQITKEIILTRKVEAKESFNVISWWDEDTKKQCKKIVKKAVCDNLINQLIEQDLVKINYKTQGDLIIAEAEIEVLERKPKEY